MGLINSNYNGTITVDGLNLKDITNEWFANLSYVSQDNILLDYSIIENITTKKIIKKLMKKNIRKLSQTRD